MLYVYISYSDLNSVWHRLRTIAGSIERREQPLTVTIWEQGTERSLVPQQLMPRCLSNSPASLNKCGKPPKERTRELWPPVSAHSFNFVLCHFFYQMPSLFPKKSWNWKPDWTFGAVTFPQLCFRGFYPLRVVQVFKTNSMDMSFPNLQGNIINFHFTNRLNAINWMPTILQKSYSECWGWAWLVLGCFLAVLGQLKQAAALFTWVTPGRDLASKSGFCFSSPGP